jgi:penicillin-binding protein 2
METESPRLRLSILGLVALSLFGALFARLWYLQIMAAPEFQVEAQAVRTRVIAEEAPRGRILDAKGRLIVDNRASLVVTMKRQDVPAGEPEREALFLRLAETLTDFGVPAKVSGIERRLDDPQYHPLQPVPIAIDVPEELLLYLAEHADRFPSVEVRRESVRWYREGTTAAHLLGYVGRISESEFEERKSPDAPKPYQPDSQIGKGGVEGTFEDELRGTPGIRVIEVDAKNRPIRTVEYTAPQPGNDIQLTIDLDIQRLVEQSMAEQLLQIRGRQERGQKLEAPAGAAVVLDPRDGGVLALASHPAYDPQEFVNGISPTRYLQLRDAPDRPLLDRTIQGLYAPGSTFKPFTAYAAMSRGMINADTTYNDQGVYRMATGVFRNAGGRQFGPVNVERSLRVSSNVFYAWLGNRFYEEQEVFGAGIQDSARQFGFGSASGIQLPGESAGMIPDAETRQARHEANPEAFPEGRWYPGDLANTAVGQGEVLVSPLQLATAYGAIANGGTVYQPTIVSKVLVAHGNPDDPADVLRVIEPVVKAEIPMPPEIQGPIVAGLVGVTSGDGGTATSTFRGFDQTFFQVAGKTGTAEVQGLADTSVFAAFAPAAAPRFVAVAILEESGYGGSAAAPMIRRVFEPLAGFELSDPDEILAGRAD